MFIIEIIKHPQPGYSDPVFSWECPLCTRPRPHLKQNLDQHFVGRMATRHLVTVHRSEMSCLQIEVRDGNE